MDNTVTMTGAYELVKNVFKNFDRKDWISRKAKLKKMIEEKGWSTEEVYLAYAMEVALRDEKDEIEYKGRPKSVTG